MTYKIAFFDVDGTITNHQDGSISTKTKEAILALKEKGMKVVAATGRQRGGRYRCVKILRN